MDAELARGFDKMTDDFSNRLDAQREFLKTVNSFGKLKEELCGLSEGALQRWIIANNLPSEAKVVLLSRKAGDILHSLANKSQEQISDQYKSNSQEFRRVLNKLRALKVN